MITRAFRLTMMFFLALQAGAHAQTAGDLDKFVGAYKATSILIFHVRHGRDGLYLQASNSPDGMALLPQSANSFTDAMSGGRFSFSGEGADTVLTASHGVTVFRAKRISEAAARALEDAVAARVKANVPSPGTEGSARRYIASLENGAPNYDEMDARVAKEAHDQLSDTLAEIHNWGF